MNALHPDGFTIIIFNDYHPYSRKINGIRSIHLIQVIDYHKTYRDTVAVRGLSFEVNPGEILGLVGPNGAGKTTTLRALAGIIPPTQGKLQVAGHDIINEPVEAKSKLAYVPDNPNLFDNLTVWEHLLFSAGAYQVAHLNKIGDELLAKFDMTEHKHKLAQELSRGMRQKVAICCAYLHDPKVILFDEPHTGLDPRGIRTIKDSIREKAQAGAAIIISSHMLALVEDLCTNLLILHHGQSLFSGKIGDARKAFADVDGDATLEEVFFRVTEKQNGATESSPAPANGV